MSIEVTDEMVKAVMKQLAQKKTPKRAAASRENGKRGGRPMAAIGDLACTCDGCPDTPKTTCPRGRAIRRRRNA